MENDKTNVPFIVHESIIARMERTIKRLWILCILMFISLIITNGIWVCYENSFEDTITTEITQDLNTDGGGNAIINDGVHINGTSETNSQNN